MRKIRLTLAYDGTDFWGWQVQPKGRTVQGELERALTRLLNGHLPRVTAAGRTDTGVHALCQVVSFPTPSPLPLRAFLEGVNSMLPFDMAITRAEEVPLAFDARFSAYSKTYQYRIFNAPHRHPLEHRTSWHVPHALDEAAMDQAARLLVGIHDFASLRATGCSSRSPVRHIFRSSCFRQGPYVLVEVEGTAFLKQMIRILVGTLTQVGKGRMTVEAFRAALAARDRRAAGPTAPPQGLLLAHVHYPEGFEPQRVAPIHAKPQELLRDRP